MTDPAAFEARVADLRRRWEDDPSSRVFLQLAEEYRRAGRFNDALQVLERGLSEHPTYVSARVALGRTRLEMGDAEAASAALAEVVVRDPTHMVANKLLAEARLRCGDVAGARERLDLYRLLNDGDPEIADLKRRLEAASSAPEAPPEEGPAAPMPEAVSPPPPPVQAPAAASNGARGAVRTGSPEPFAALFAAGDHRLYLAALGAAGIFPLELAPEPAVAAEEVVAIAVEQAPLPAPEAPPVPSAPGAPVAPPEIETGAAAAAEVERAPAPAAGVASPAALLTATVTLGQLYLEQHHFAEAERTFRAVLERDPGNAAALLGLGEVERLRPRPLTAAELLRWAAERRGAAAAGPRSGRVALLEAYLARIREGNRADVP